MGWGQGLGLRLHAGAVWLGLRLESGWAGPAAGAW